MPEQARRRSQLKPEDWDLPNLAVCPHCAGRVIPRAILSTDTEEVLVCFDCKKELARRPIESREMSYITTRNLCIVSLMKLYGMVKGGFNQSDEV